MIRNPGLAGVSSRKGMRTGAEIEYGSLRLPQLRAGKFLVQPGVDAALKQQCFVRAAFDDAAIFEQQDEVRFAHRAEALRDFSTSMTFQFDKSPPDFNATFNDERVRGSWPLRAGLVVSDAPEKLRTLGMSATPPAQ